MSYLWRWTPAPGPAWGPAGCVEHTCWGRRSSRWELSAVLWSAFDLGCHSSGRICPGSGCTGSAASSGERGCRNQLLFFINYYSILFTFFKESKWGQWQDFVVKGWWCEGFSWNLFEKHMDRAYWPFGWYICFLAVAGSFLISCQYHRFRPTAF